MHANELRIGNVVLFGGEIISVNTRHIAFINNANRLKNKGTFAFEPINLTEGELLKLGFKKPSFTYDFNKLSICLKGREYKNGRTYFKGWCIIESQVEYIHQLQNLYFALTGQELIKVKV